MGLKIGDILQKICKIISVGKIKTKDQMTTVIGALVGIVFIVLNQFAGINLPEDQQLTVVGIIVSMIFLFWKPKEEEE